ncbi:speckle-type POZ protein B-like [Copidosoma floridanum]|uniref:speckle-type POZ protein B-like n=1 Tax=Copidosoma floridanum TaxID=29053 RepID=UPI0006C9DE50|nr:speckle-type POZ protein B-like [Copidosoma floridanum]
MVQQPPNSHMLEQDVFWLDTFASIPPGDIDVLNAYFSVVLGYLGDPRWCIPRYKDLLKHAVKSHCFNAGRNNCLLAWDNDRKIVSLYFYKCCLTNDELNKNVKTAIVDSNGCKQERKNDNIVQKAGLKVLIFNFKQYELFLEYNVPENLEIVCFIPDIDESIIEIDDKNSPSHSDMDLTNLLESGEFSDVILVTRIKDECLEISAHKAILASRSSVFQKMFTTEMKEKTENKVEIQEFKIEVVQEMLKYIYSGKLDNSVALNISEDLLKAADYYDLDLLKKMIVNICKDNLTHSNAFRYLMLADTYKVSKLKQAAINYIVKIDEMVKTEGFNSIPDSQMHLMKDLLIALKNN